MATHDRDEIRCELREEIQTVKVKFANDHVDPLRAEMVLGFDKIDEELQVLRSAPPPTQDSNDQVKAQLAAQSEQLRANAEH